MAPEEQTRPHELKNLTDRDLMEAVYRGIYGEEPIHPGLAKRVTRLERGVFFIVLVLVSAGLIEVAPNLLNAIAGP